MDKPIEQLVRDCLQATAVRAINRLADLDATHHIDWTGMQTDAQVMWGRLDEIRELHEVEKARASRDASTKA